MSKIDSDTSKKTLYLDIGNSTIKGAYKMGTQWMVLSDERLFSALELVNWIQKHPNSFGKIVLASVRDDVSEAIERELGRQEIKEVSVSDIPRDLLNYETPKTLGIDRFLSCYGATNQTNKSVVVIDAGTATTIDFMDQDDVFHGGVIIPGLWGFSEVLSQKAPALPFVELEIPGKWPGKSTIDSLKWGQAGFYKMGIIGFLDKYEEEFGQYDLFITGGDALEIESMLERETKVRPFLVFEGIERLVRQLESNK
ncbi:type III pantothenate kinase [Gracilimonas sp. Q87]|uniref:type III pantothenate kinase n=1 Tax=Gracilimonas sp. Q87 TaxID=3384766 RepID=UPI0039841A6E